MSTVEYPLAEPTKESLLFITFSFGSPVQFVRYTDWDSAVTHPVNGFTYDSMVGTNVELPKNTGLFKEPTCGIALPANPFTNRISSGEPWPETLVVIEELTQDPDQTTGRMLTLFIGEMRRTIRNYQGNPNSVQVEIENLKSSLTVPMGLVATDHCVAIFGARKICDPSGTSINLDTLKQTGTMTTVDGVSVTVTGLTNPRERYWFAGFVEISGLRIKIRDWEIATPTLFRLVKSPPSDWLNATVTVTPGCDKTEATCLLWNNQQHFLGCGYAMPAYQPVLEVP